MYRDANLKTVVIIPTFFGKDIICTTSVPVFHQTLGLNAPFKKPDLGILKYVLNIYFSCIEAHPEMISILGTNVLTTEGDTWKKHRRITAPAFNHATYRNVWETTARVYDDMLKQEGWLHVDETRPAEFNRITHKESSFVAH